MPQPAHDLSRPSSTSHGLRVAVGTSSQLAADVAADIASVGGNAVDAALAVMIVSILTEPGICALGGGGYITVSDPADGGAVWTVDASMEMPGRSAPAEWFGHAPRVARMTYGGGVETTVGYESVATPGAVAGIAAAWQRWGSVPWRVLWEPAAHIARAGFPLGSASDTYLVYSREPIFGWHPASRAALYHGDGTAKVLGDPVRPDGRVDLIDAIATDGAATFYTGDVAGAVADEFEMNGGLMSRADLAAYRPILRPAASIELGDWRISTNPPPAIGGVALLALMDLTTGDAPLPHHEAQRRVFGYRRSHLDDAPDRASATERMLDEVMRGAAAGWGSPSTVHTSTVDDGGLACAVTMSAGYGSGVMPGGTGMWFNNSLGEAELNGVGYHGLRPGTRLASNMAPTIARAADGRVISIGSPGADRITSALGQVLHSVSVEGAPLTDAVAAHRCHIEFVDGVPRVVAEPDAIPETELDVRRFDGLDMFFGGVAAAARSASGELESAADPRRAGGTLVV